MCAGMADEFQHAHRDNAAQCPVVIAVNFGRGGIGGEVDHALFEGTEISYHPLGNLTVMKDLLKKSGNIEGG